MDWFIALLKDLHVTHVFDATPGSGAVACAAAILNISYEGVAMSAKHTFWLDYIMDKAIFAAVRLRETHQIDQEAELREPVIEYFKCLIAEGRKFVERVDDHRDEDGIKSDDE